MEHNGTPDMRPWCPDMDDVLCDYFLSGYTVYEIMREMNLPYERVLLRLAKHTTCGNICYEDFGAKQGLEEQPKHFLDKDFVREAEQEMSFMPCGKIRNFDPSDPDCRMDIQRLREEGNGTTAIARLYGVDFRTMARYLAS